MPTIPNFIERVVLLRLNRGPAAVLDLFGAAGFESVALALRLGLFETLAAAGPSSATELAAQTDTDPTGIARLCDFLVAERYLSRADGRYRLTAMTERWLLDDAATNMGPFFTFWAELVFPFWEREFETAVREGAPSQTIYEWFDEAPGRWAIAQAGFRSGAALLAEDVAAATTIEAGAERVIDVGGGHGLYGFELCRRYPSLSTTIFDLPGAVDTVEIPGDLEGRVETVAGDYRTDDLGTDYDVALLGNVIHAQDPTANTALFRRVADALGPDGRIVVLDQWAGSGRTPVGRTYLRFIALTYLTTLDADVYPYEAVKGWLEEAGFTGVNSTSVGPLSGVAIVEATKA